jgi:FkbM family methyltransferase
MSIVHTVLSAARDLASSPHLIKQRSYSTPCEDAMFFSAFKPGNRGFYVDVGANHPKFGSNTYRLYRQGWSGLAIEPNPAFAKPFSMLRPRDKFVCEGVSPKEGSLKYFAFDNPNYNTFSSERAHEMVSRWHQKVVSTNVIKVRPLTAIIGSFCPDTHIDLLSVDCEDLDLAVLQSADLQSRRPTAILVEDFDGLAAFQNGRGESEICRFLREQGYVPIGQCLLSALYVSTNWRELFKRSRAFDAARVRYFPPFENE